MNTTAAQPHPTPAGCPVHQGSHKPVQAPHQIAEPAIILTEQDATLLTQASEMLEDYSAEQRRRGNCSAAEGAECSAHAVQRLGVAMLAAQRDALTQAAHDVLAERARQIAQEGYDTEHDDSHVNDEIAAMAALFVMPEAARDWDASSTGYGHTLGEAILPADWNYPRLGARRDQLVKGAAMVLAEIERIDRTAIAANAASAVQGGA